MRLSGKVAAIFAALALLILGAAWWFVSTRDRAYTDWAMSAWEADGGDPKDCTELADPAPAKAAVHCGAGVGGRLYQFDSLGRMTVSRLADPDDAAKE